MMFSRFLSRVLSPVTEALHWSRFGSLLKSRIDRSNYEKALLEKRPVIQKSVWNSDGCLTDLCLLALKYPCDKSPVSIETSFRHAYTPIYNTLFGPLKNKCINLAEIGILYGHSLQIFRDFFPNATICGFEGDAGMREMVNDLNLKDTSIHFLDVLNEGYIRNAFKETGLLFDIIIDDSSHRVEDQIRIILTCFPFLKPGGMMIIEDIFDNKRSPEVEFEKAVQELGDEVAFSSFLFPENRGSFVGDWDNEKLLLLVKS